MLGNGFLVMPRKRGGFAHEFCGPHEISGARCPNCKKPLLRFLSLNCEDPNLAKFRNKLPHVHLVFCWTCNLAQKPLYYRQMRGEIILLKWGKGGRCKDFPYVDYPVAFPPALVSLVRIADSDAETMARVVSGDVRPHRLPRRQQWLGLPKHQVGGCPVGVDSALAPKCCKCKARMHLFATICDIASRGRVFVGNEFVQVAYWLCERDCILCAQQSCD